jgi:predicted PurR-regulated permease PerM
MIVEINKKNVINTALGLGLGLFVYRIRSILSPFIFGFFVAYCVKNIVTKLEKKIPRELAAILIILVICFIFAAFLLFLIPLIYQQVMETIKQCLGFVERFNVEQFYNDFSYLFKILHIETAEELQTYINNFSRALVKQTGSLTNFIINSSTQAANFMFKIFLFPIITYYFIVDWKKIMKYIFKAIPNMYKNNALDLMSKINITMHHYIVGQILVTLIISTIYSILLLAIDFDFAVLIGVLAGFLTLLPYIGSIGGFMIASMLVFLKYGVDISRLISVSCVFGLGQFLEGNFITPNIIGNRIQVHPLWIIFSMLAGGRLYGFWGIIISVPIVAIVGVVVRYNRQFKIKQLKKKKTL